MGLNPWYLKVCHSHDPGKSRHLDIRAQFLLCINCSVCANELIVGHVMSKTLDTVIISHPQIALDNAQSAFANTSKLN
jgi:hypothetical protein